ncbi:MAG TPA: hypothetical protein PKM43_04665 [Verrucomicrobiota bacterium]|nr:hypothetical protein [Verrucomicrobiota bacterium]HRZ34931.1 hypothetical protein [Candidatus Paceibacterota bacterium]HRZ53827.1 hypothetical protein [Candidatus Paceibacterota bacterium]
MKTRSKTHILLAISGLALATAPGYAQTNGPLPIIWQAAYGPGMSGGVGYALPYDFIQTSDGSFLIAGTCEGPANGIRTEPFCLSADAWVIKIDAQGQRQWDKSCGGGTTWAPGDYAHRVFLTPDGGFLLAGFTTSAPACCKTAPLRGPSGYAYPNNLWVVRYDANDDKLWDQSYLPEGLSGCYGFDFTPTEDGGYLGCGPGTSGQITATAVYGGMAKFDAQGQQLWTKTVGCARTSDITYLLVIRNTSDGGFIVAGCSNAQPCADKTSPYFGGHDSNIPHLGSDFWVVRFDAQQNKLWDKSYGGAASECARDIHPLADGGFMVFGNSQSLPVTDPSKGTKTSRRYGNQDFWVVRIDAEGNQLWDKSYGGVSDDICTCAEPMPDGGWLLSGTSCSRPSGNKTAPHFGGWDFWIVRIDDQGNKLWDQSFGGRGDEGKIWRTFQPPVFMRERIRRTTDGGFLLTGFSQSPPGGLKTAPLISQGDFWVLKLGPEPPSLRGEFTAEGQFQLCLIAPPELEHTIQGSADLVTWTDLATLGPNPDGKEYWNDPEKLAHRFYRAARK